MSAVAVTDQRQQLFDSLRQLFESLGNAGPREYHCWRCGARRKQVSGRFWLYGSEESWEVPLSYCLNCNPEVSGQGRVAVWPGKNERCLTKL